MTQRPSFRGITYFALLSVSLGSCYVRGAEPGINGELRLQPASMTLTHPRQPRSVLVSSTMADGNTIDLTGAASYSSGDEKIAAVDSFGWVRPVVSGKT